MCVNQYSMFEINTCCNKYNINDTIINSFNDYINKINNDDIEIGLSVFTSSNLIRFNTINKGLAFNEIKNYILKYRMNIIIEYFMDAFKAVNKEELIKYYLDNIKDNYSCVYEPPSFDQFIKNIDDDDGFNEELAIRYRCMFPTIEQLNQYYYRFSRNDNNTDCENCEDYMTECNYSNHEYSDSFYEDYEDYEDYNEEIWTDDEY